MTAQTQERRITGPAVDERDQGLFMPRPDEPVTAYAARLRDLRTNLDTLIATVERGAEARPAARSEAAPGTVIAPVPVTRPTHPAARLVSPGPPRPVEIIKVDDDRAARIADDERRWATERRQRLTERRIAPDRRVGRSDNRSHPNERRSGIDERRGGTDDRRLTDRRAPVITEPSPVLNPITWVWVLQAVIWIGIAVAALVLT